MARVDDGHSTFHEDTAGREERRTLSAIGLLSVHSPFQ